MPSSPMDKQKHKNLAGLKSVLKMAQTAKNSP